MKRSILIVDDNTTKLEAIRRALPKSITDVNAVNTISQAYRVISARRWDLLILDMTFQVSPGIGKEIAKEPLAGVELLQYVSRSRIDTKVIVATQHTVFSSRETQRTMSFSELDSFLARSFARHYSGIVKVDLSTAKWRRDLLKKIEAAFNEA